MSAKDFKETIGGWDSAISLRQKLTVVDSPPQRGQGETDVLQMCLSNGSSIGSRGAGGNATGQKKQAAVIFNNPDL